MWQIQSCNQWFASNRKKPKNCNKLEKTSKSKLFAKLFPVPILELLTFSPSFKSNYNP
jgi:hypothetical protein